MKALGSLVLCSLLCCAGQTLCSNTASADTVTVGTILAVSTQEDTNLDLFHEDDFFANLMSDTTLIIASETATSTNTAFTICATSVCATNLNDTLLPGAPAPDIQTLLFNNNAGPGLDVGTPGTLSFAGSIGASTFTVGGVQYQTTDVNWVVPAFSDANILTRITIPIEITATPVSPVPEPSSLLLISAGLLGVGTFTRKAKKQV